MNGSGNKSGDRLSRWLLANCGGMPHDPDLWDYTEAFDRLFRKARKELGDDGLTERKVILRAVWLRKGRKRAKECGAADADRLPSFRSAAGGREGFIISKGEASLLASLYAAERLTVDKIRYTSQFERIYRGLVEKYPKRTRAFCWQALIVLRKRGELPPKEKKPRGRGSGGHRLGFDFSR